MKWILLGLVVIPGLLLFGLNPGNSEGPETVTELNVRDYMGKWYAIASIEKFFNRDCAWGNSAEYTLRPDGKITVLNSCYTEKGKERRVSGVAWIPDESEPGKLKVSFVSFLGFNLFAADYWVLELGQDYDYAVIGNPGLSFGWILSRKPELEEEKLENIITRLEDIGYDFSDFKINPQSAPSKM